MSGTRTQLAVAQQELRQIERAIDTRREQVRLGRETADRYHRIAGEKYVSQVQIDQQQQAVLELVTEHQSLECQATSLRRGIAQMEQAQKQLATSRQQLTDLEEEGRRNGWR